MRTTKLQYGCIQNFHMRNIIWSIWQARACYEKIDKHGVNKVYHGGDIEANGCEEEWEHAREIEKLAKPINISSKNLLSVSASHFGLKGSYLVQTNISPLPNLANDTTKYDLVGTLWYISPTNIS